jgi:metallo-beta-lactamase family protein
MNISFHGAARTVTGSKHLVHLDNGKKILLDCGMFQGMGAETLELNRQFGFDPAEVTYVILSHAHIDHVGLLPKLVKDGFNGRIFCTPQTAELVKLLLLDSAHIQEIDVAHINRVREGQERELAEALYTQEDAEKVFPLLESVSYHHAFKIDKQVELYYTDCGHLLGSAAVNLKIKEGRKITRLTFSGDIGRYSDMILRAPEAFPQADYIIMEATYGDKTHNMLRSPTDKLLEYIERSAERGGKLIIPAFSVGRTQEILYLINRLDMEHRLPKINYYVDSPLSVEATAVMKRHPECFNDAVRDLLQRDDDVFSFPGLHNIKNTEDSINLTVSKEPCVIIAASGMAEAGRVKHHIAANIDNPANTILIVGYCEPHSLGGKLRSGAGHVNIYGEGHEVRAKVEVIESMSAHGDYDDLLKWTSCQDPQLVKNVFLVHGEYSVQQAFREKLHAKGFRDVQIPQIHENADLNNLTKRHRKRIPVNL